MLIYSYKKCSTCRNALKFLEAKKIKVEVKEIVDSPPKIPELKQMLKITGDIKKLFNTSGILYREMNLKDKLPNLSEQDALGLLAKNGKLVKRPFLLGENLGLLGFKEQEWESTFP